MALAKNNLKIINTKNGKKGAKNLNEEEQSIVYIYGIMLFNY